MAAAPEIAYQFKPHERPTLPGSPANPDHPPLRRVGYFLISCLVGLAGGLGLALVQVNLNYLQGALGLGPVEGQWVIAAYYSTNVTANLVLIKFRQEFGLQRFVRIILIVYAASTMAHLLFHDFRTAVLVRIFAGLAGSGLTTMTVLYMMQSMPPPKRIVGAMLGIALPQLATPFARMVSPGLLTEGGWRPTYWLELGFALATLAAVTFLPLPPSERIKAFERRDFLTIALLAPGIWLLVAVLAQGRLQWWTDTQWIGFALAGATALIASALIHEYGRANPLIDVRWLGRREVVRLILVASFVRILLSEQTVGSIGLLTAVGMGPDQLVSLNAVILAASVAGLIGILFLFRPADVTFSIAISVALIAFGAFLDSGATNLSRPANLYFSQALIGFAAIVFLGSAMAIGLARALLEGGRVFISYIMLFSASQSLGALAGSALIGTFEILREKFHSHSLVSSINLADPLVAGRLRITGGALASTIGDSAQRNATAAALLGRSATREATVLAYNDVFLMACILSVLMLIYNLWLRHSFRVRGELSPLVLLQQRMMAAQAAANEDNERGPS